MFDPNQAADKLTRALCTHLGYPVEFVQATRLNQSTRTAPWKVVVTADGVEERYVLQLDANTITAEYRALKAMAQRSPCSLVPSIPL